MNSTQDNVRQQLETAVTVGNDLFKKLVGKQDVIEFGTEYQAWYTKTLPLVKALAPDRFQEFRSYYEADSKRKGIDTVSYVMQDYVNGAAPAPNYRGEVAFDHHQVAISRLLNQVQILASLSSRIDSVLANVEGHLLADLEDAELSAAATLAKSNLRAAGTLAGVVLERHLANAAKNRGIKVGKNPTIGEINEALKKEGAYDLTTYRKVQYLGDIRNVCCHNKGREPSRDQVSELLTGVDSIIKGVF